MNLFKVRKKKVANAFHLTETCACSRKPRYKQIYDFAKTSERKKTNGNRLHLTFTLYGRFRLFCVVFCGVKAKAWTLWTKFLKHIWFMDFSNFMKGLNSTF